MCCFVRGLRCITLFGPHTTPSSVQPIQCASNLTRCAEVCHVQDQKAKEAAWAAKEVSLERQRIAALLKNVALEAKAKRVREGVVSLYATPHEHDLMSMISMRMFVLWPG